MYAMNASSKLTTKYQVTLPSYVRDSLGIKPSDKVTFSINLKNEVVLKKVKSLDEVMGSVKSGKPIDEIDIHKIAREHVVDLYKKKWRLQ
ncbi:hypothetical protein CO058_02605 [candidate division WWE3 bacterium CG_4_9_14_0_2_um_filter_35_11]|uniref:SpoVT-AbrB domain-containing protein n=1 Tax=candidate division WWE3 bacterium CG_4_9_14_0_2_um_filter_35_11 TaxID=1975077 RepID=A0A2M8ELK9_UNCKA|nr:MAG: hypothetical protein COV25_02865 [candidate division WWE3 bacterium CG10_big_fil_rev_8_21_14_0_10_35_32]PJC23626.1 MAG: hypothetical protein CO058_02605 [candidate division WWE3 bacterium CG_4_9_14_0_2_um_filter_35_11]